MKQDRHEPAPENDFRTVPEKRESVREKGREAVPEKRREAGQHNRHAAIMEIITAEDVGTQTELTRLLNERGFDVTQATVSRDIRRLHLVKESAGNGVWRYAAAHMRREIGEKLHTIFRESVLSVQEAQNIVVIKTMPGLADGACSALDQMNIDGMVGSLAGDDTAFIAMRDTESALRLCGEIQTMLR